MLGSSVHVFLFIVRGKNSICLLLFAHNRRWQTLLQYMAASIAFVIAKLQGFSKMVLGFLWKSVIFEVLHCFVDDVMINWRCHLLLNIGRQNIHIDHWAFLLLNISVDALMDSLRIQPVTPSALYLTWLYVSPWGDTPWIEACHRLDLHGWDHCVLIAIRIFHWYLHHDRGFSLFFRFLFHLLLKVLH